MPKAPIVIHQYGRPVRARLPNGDVVERQDMVLSNGILYPALDYDNHFVYRYGKNIGSVLRCTCGSDAAEFGYSAYKKYCSYMGEKVIGCIMHLQTGCHGDGST